MIRDIFFLSLSLLSAFAASWVLATQGLPLYGPANPWRIALAVMLLLLGTVSLIALVGIPQKPHLPTYQSERTGA